MNYLSKLKNLINEIIPIRGLYNKNSEIKVQFYSDNMPSEGQVEQINNIIANFDVNLEKAKNNYENLLLSNWSIRLNEGWQSPYGWNLGIKVEDVSLLNGLFTLAKEASILGINDPVSIVDINGLSHELSLSDLTNVMLAYGQARSQLSNLYALKTQNIKNATSIEELESLDLTI